MKNMILLKWLAIQWEEVTSHLTVNNFGLSGMFKKDDKGLVESQNIYCLQQLQDWEN